MKNSRSKNLLILALLSVLAVVFAPVATADPGECCPSGGTPPIQGGE